MADVLRLGSQMMVDVLRPARVTDDGRCTEARVTDDGRCTEARVTDDGRCTEAS